MDSTTALAIAEAMQGQWQKKPGERDTEKVKRIWGIMSRVKVDMETRNSPGTNTGHGHVWPRPDGMKARCGGPGLCVQCSRDAARKQLSVSPAAGRTGTDTPSTSEANDE